mgnify:FL=1
MKRFLLLGAISLLTACHSYETVNTSVYMDSSRPTKERVEALLRQMTLDEKIGQMDMVSEWDEQAIFDKGYYNFGAWICGQSLEQLNKMQTLSNRMEMVTAIQESQLSAILQLSRLPEVVRYLVTPMNRLYIGYLEKQQHLHPVELQRLIELLGQQP